MNFLCFARTPNCGASKETIYHPKAWGILGGVFPEDPVSTDNGGGCYQDVEPLHGPVEGHADEGFGEI